MSGEVDPRGDVPDVRPPEYERDQYLPVHREESAAHNRLLRHEFGRIRAFYKRRPAQFANLQRRLNQGRFGETYDRYLTRATWVALAVGLLGALLGLATTVLLARWGVLADLSGPNLGGGPVVEFLAANRVAVIGVSLTVIGAVLSAAATWLGFFYYPYAVADARRRNMEIMLPHAIVYMYALSFGGMDFSAVLKQMADADETYGEVAREFDAIVRDVEVFGNDLFTALRNARNLTPSDGVEAFLDDMLSVLDSGGDMADFLRNESEKYMDQAADEQESFLESLATLSEVFIVGFVAAPLFLIVTLMMMSFLGADTFVMLFLLVYVVMPAGLVAFLAVISVLSRPYEPPKHRLESSLRGGEADETVRRHPSFDEFRDIRRRERLRAFLRDPIALFKQRPTRVLAVSVPAALLLVALLVGRGVVSPTVDGFFEAPVVTGVGLIAAPFVVAALPLSVLHEYRRHRQNQIARRFPDALNLLASANQMGVRLTEGLDLLARNFSGHFAEELRKVRNDIRWNHDIRRALLDLAARLDVPQLTRTCKIIAEGSRSTGNLHRVLSIAAQDTRHRYRLDRARHRQLSSYTAIVVVGFLVYLGVVVVIDQSFLTPVVERLSATEVTAGPITIAADDVSLYHAIFFHSALLQAIGTGLITGKLDDNDVLSGLKFSIALMVIAVGVFWLL